MQDAECIMKRVVHIDEVREYYTQLLISAMSWLVKRYHEYADYGWINTKVNLLTGKDFEDSDLLRGRKTIYGWIQGRALEALAGHAVWMRQVPGTDDLIESIRDIISRVYAKLDNARNQNNGHLSFMMDVDGKAFIPDEWGNKKIPRDHASSVFNYSDLFGAKGMYAAARFLNDAEKIEDSKQYCLDVIDALWNRNFVSGQYSFRGVISGAEDVTFSLGPYMLCMNMMTNMLSDDATYTDEGMRLLQHIVQRHINSPPKWDFGEEYDCVENTAHDGMPLIEDGKALSDPGHCVEFTGFALKFLHALGQSPPGEKYKTQISDLRSLCIKVLIRNFENGFVYPPGGICKTFDLVGRRVLDFGMPWWSLPETMRAVAYALHATKNDETAGRLSHIFSQCHRSFTENYLSGHFNYIAIQTLGIDGRPAEIIPATPDADPGYHTGLSLIDCLSVGVDTSGK